MQSRPSEFSQRSTVGSETPVTPTTQHGNLHSDGSPASVSAGHELDAGAIQDQLPAFEEEDSRVEQRHHIHETTGLRGRNSGKRTPSPVDKIIEHERAMSSRPTPDRTPAFRVVARSKNAPAPRVSLQDMPAELLTHVCSYLPADAISSMSVVSKKMRQIVTGEQAWRTAFARYFPGHEALNETTAVKLDRLGEEVLVSEKRFFTRLTALSSWRSDYIIRTRLLRALGRGSPSEVDNLTGYSGSRGHAKATRVSQMDFFGGLDTPITHISGSFELKNNRPQVRFLHASTEECRASLSRPLESNKHIAWGFDMMPRLQFYDVQPNVDMYGLGPGDVVGVPNSLDLSPIYGLLVADGMPGGRVYHRHVNEDRGVYLARSMSDGAPDKGVPRVSELESMTAVWIAKKDNIPEITNGLVCALVGSSSGVVTACSLGSSTPTGGTRSGTSQVTARWALSPGVPIIGFGVDESFSKRRLQQGRIWAFALNALGEVFCLKDIPERPTPAEVERHPSDWTLNVQAWETGRSVRWSLVEPTRRTAKPDPFAHSSADASYSPQSSSKSSGLSEAQTAAETLEIEQFMSKPPIHFRTICDGWDMQRRLEVDFAGDDEHGGGEAVFVIACGLQERQKASISRHTRLMIEDVVRAPADTEDASDGPQRTPLLVSKPSLFGGVSTPAETAWNITQPTNVRRISQSSESGEIPEERFEVWRTSDYSFKGLRAVQITTSAKDDSTYAGLTVDEDPLLSLNPVAMTWSPSASPIGGTQRFAHASDVPGQRARLLAVGTKFGSVLVWNMRAPTSANPEIVNEVEPVRIIHTDSPGISSLAVSALFLVHGGSDGLVQAWDPLAHETGPVRTLHSKFSQKARRDLRNNQARASGVGINFYAANAICLDPDPKVLRGIVSIGTHLRYWSYSSGSAGAYRGSKRRSQRDRQLSNQATPAKVTRTGRGTLADYIANEQADLERSKRDRKKETDKANARYGLNLLGEDATEDEIMAYATMISEEAHASDRTRRMSLTSSSADSLLSSPGLPAAASSSIAGQTDPEPEDAQLARALASADDELAEALERSLQDSSPTRSASFEPEPEDLGFTVKFAKSRKGRRSPNRKTPSSTTSPNLAGASRGSESDDLEYALQLSLAEEQSRREIEDQFPSLRRSPTPPGKGKGRAIS